MSASLWRRIWASAKVRYSCLLIAILLLLTLGAGWLSPHSYDEMDAGLAFSAPGGDYLLGGEEGNVDLPNLHPRT